MGVILWYTLHFASAACPGFVVCIALGDAGGVMRWWAGRVSGRSAIRAFGEGAGAAQAPFATSVLAVAWWTKL